MENQVEKSKEEEILFLKKSILNTEQAISDERDELEKYIENRDEESSAYDLPKGIDYIQREFENRIEEYQQDRYEDIQGLIAIEGKRYYTEEEKEAYANKYTSKMEAMN